MEPSEAAQRLDAVLQKIRQRMLREQSGLFGDLSPAQFLLLRTISTRGGPAPVSALAADLATSASAVTMLSAPLVDAGWLRREPSPRDRRIVNLHLTEAGRLRLEAAVTQRQACFARRLALLGADRVAEMLALLEQWASLMEVTGTTGADARMADKGDRSLEQA